VYQLFNKELFESQLPAPEFLTDFARSGILCFSTPATLLFCQSFPDAKRTAILDDLVHQMIHIENHQRGIEDHTSNQYHKKEFCIRALEVGLHVKFNSSRGWAITTSEAKVSSSNVTRCATKVANQKLRGLYRSIEWDDSEFREFKGQLRSEFSIRQQQSKQYQLKYVCECLPPHNTIRSGRRPDGQRPLDATCNICGAKFVLAMIR